VGAPRGLEESVKDNLDQIGYSARFSTRKVFDTESRHVVGIVAGSRNRPPLPVTLTLLKSKLFVVNANLPITDVSDHYYIT